MRSTLRRVISIALLAACLAGCEKPGLAVGGSRFFAYPVQPADAYKSRITISDTKARLFGMQDVAVGLEIEYSQFKDTSDVDWTYVRVGVPLVAARRMQSGFWDQALVRGWPSLSAEQQSEYLRGPVRGLAWFMGLSGKYFRSENDEDRLYVGPSLALEWVRRQGEARAGWGLSFEVDSGLEVRDGEPYIAASIGLSLVWGGPMKW
jgi:hypothetical protein